MIFAFSLASQLERELISVRTKDYLQKKKMMLDNKTTEIKKCWMIV
jgi:hypothetical protein